MANLSAWYDEVLAQVPGCPTALADWAIRQAAIEFCELSHAHIVDLTAINSVAGTASYALSYTPDSPAWVTARAYNVGDYVTESSLVYRCLVAHIAGVFATDLAAVKWVLDTTTNATKIIKVLDVEYDGEMLTPISPRDVARKYGDNWQDIEELPLHYLSQYGTSLTLVPTPSTSVTGGIVVTACVKPTETATTIDDTIATPYKRAIAKGARKTLWLMAQKPWTAFERGAKEEQDFISECATAHVQAMKGRTLAPMRSRNFYYPDR